jgi:hypothetical protein
MPVDESLLTAKKNPIALPLSSSLNISPMTPAPSTEAGEAPMAWKNLQNKRKGTVCVEATPAEPITRTGKAHR